MVFNWRALRNNPPAMAGFIVVGLTVLLAILGPQQSPFQPEHVDATALLMPPGPSHWLGTDELGRDVFSRVAAGARVTLVVGFGSAILAALLGTLIGGISGYYGGTLDAALMRFTELSMVLPAFFLAVVMVAFFGPSMLNVIVVLGIVSWPILARIVRAEFLALCTQPFVEAARAFGMGDLRLIFTEILPNAGGSLAVATALQMSAAMLLEAGLSFLGLGDPNQVSLGLQLQEAGSTLVIAWWTSVFPGLALFAAVVGVNLAGDGISDLLDPRALKRSRRMQTLLIAAEHS